MEELLLKQKRIDSLNKIILNMSLKIDSQIFESDDDEIPFVSKSIEISKEEVIKEYINDIYSVIAYDEFEDGEISRSEKYIKDNFNTETKDYILDALMQIYLDNFNNNDEQILLGVMEMISGRKYEEVAPKGQVMSLGLLQHKNIYLRDRAIQVYEQWNSKEGIKVLKSLNCDQKWLQDYVDKVIMYLEQDGE